VDVFFDSRCIRGLLCAITYSYVVDCCNDYVAVTGNELLSYKPIPQVQVGLDEKRHVSVSCRVYNRDPRISTLKYKYKYK